MLLPTLLFPTVSCPGDAGVASPVVLPAFFMVQGNSTGGGGEVTN